MDAADKAAAIEAAARSARLAVAKKKEKYHYNQQPVRKVKVKNMVLTKVTIVSNKKSTETSTGDKRERGNEPFVYAYLREEEEEEKYSLFFANCAPESQVSMVVHTEIYNLMNRVREHLLAERERTRGLTLQIQSPTTGDGEKFQRESAKVVNGAEVGEKGRLSLSVEEEDECVLSESERK